MVHLRFVLVLLYLRLAVVILGTYRRMVVERSRSVVRHTFLRLHVWLKRQERIAESQE